MTLFAGNATGQTAPGTIIPNQAWASYSDPGGNSVTALSNQVDITTVTTRTLASLTFNRIGTGSSGVPAGPTACMQGGGAFTPLPNPVLLGGIIVDPNQPQNLTPTGLYHAGEAAFITLEDLDQNLDPGLRETIEVTVSASPGGDTEVLRLTETATDSGLFAGYVQTGTGPPISGDCVLQVSDDSSITGTYQDPNDAADSAQARAQVDPSNIVFDAGTGNPVNGITVRLVDAVSGTPATVYGADGIATFPASITSGGSVTDGGGQVYNFPPGGYRFPVVPAGNYRLEVDVPSAYLGISSLSIGELQTLPGAPFTLANGSFGTTFTVDNTLAINLDIPLDPDPLQLYLQKSAGSEVAAAGDFVQYSLKLENTSLEVQPAITLSDILPVGFRLVSGSVYIDDTPAPDPGIGPDGRTLTFTIGDLDPGANIKIRYVTEVTVGASGEAATNIAIASSTSGVDSNEANATVQLVEDLFTSKAIVVGRAILDNCDADVSNDANGVAGLRIYMEDGRYAITDDGGRFHFEGLEPGTHVVQLDVDSVPEHLEIITCNSNSRFAGRNYSRFVDLRAGALWRADFYLQEKPQPTGNINLELDGERAGVDTILYKLKLSGGGLPVTGVVLNLMLPDGVTYVPGTTVINGQFSRGPETPASVVSYRLGDKPAVWEDHILLRGQLTGTASGDLLAKAVASFTMANGENGKTPVAENKFEYRPELNELLAANFVPHFAPLRARLSDSDLRELDLLVTSWSGGDDALLTATGHTDANPVQKGHPEFADNYALSLARAAAVANYVATKLGLPASQVRVNGRGPDEPVATNDTDAGRAKNRRVELLLERKVLISPAELGDNSLGIGQVSAQTTGTHNIAVDDLLEFSTELVDAPVFSEAGYIESLRPDTRWLAPVADYSPPIPAMKIAIQHKPDDIIELSVNGKAVDPLNFIGQELNRRKTVAISRWRGVDLQDGNNQLVAVVSNADRSEFKKLETSVHYGGGPVRAVLDRESSRLIADGTTRPFVAVRLFDRYGKPARPSTTGGFKVDPPYRTQWEVDSLTENQLVAVGDREALYRVGPNGLAYLQLEPTTLSGEATLRLKFTGNHEQEIRVWMEPAPRDWIMVGFAEGTLGHNTLSDNMVTAEDSGYENDTYTDGKMSFFAKGQVKGEYLLTLAYNSDFDDDAADNQLFGTIDPNRYYTLYGDGTEQRFEAASRRGLFLKIERQEFYALFGDFETGLSVTELAAYSRSLNGLKAEYRGESFAYNLFASDTDKGFIRDELPGDGTSGPYYLSDNPIVLNSDKIELQTRDRFRSEVIIETRPLTRYIDYSIDYQTGAIFMKRPVPSRDGSFNPIYIVANYETRESSGENISAGGRGAWNSTDGRLEVGASVIHQGTEGDSGDLIATDVRYALDEQTEITAEIATTDTDLAGSNYGLLAALDHRGENIEARAWYQELEAGFGLGQQNQSETGMRKYGVDGRYDWTERISFISAAFRQDNLVDDATQDVVEAEVQYHDSKRTAAAGLVSARDDYADSSSGTSNQAFVSGTMDVFNDLLTIRGSAETSLGGDAGSTNYPDRLLLGTDYHMSDATTVFAEIESATGSDWDSVMTRVGVQTQPWQSAQMNSTMNHQMTEFGPRTFATVGLTQGWQMNESWYFDLGLDQSRTVGDEPQRVNPDTPPASGNVNGEDFTASYVGAMYRSELWTFSSRAEYRDSDTEQRINLLGGFYREETQGHGFSANAQLLESDFDAGGSALLANLRLGWSWRPADSEWIVFDRFDLIFDRNTGGLSEIKTWKLVNNMNANWMLDSKTQIELQYGAKFARSNVGSDSYTSFTDVMGAGVRRDINERWDFGVHGDVLHSWEADVLTFGWGVDVGVTVFDNVWVSLGYNFAGFRDADFSGSNYTAQGPFITFRIKADQDTFHGLINREAEQ